LVELLITIAISGVVITAAYTFLFANQSAYFLVMARIDAQSDAKSAIDNIMTNIRSADQKELLKQQSGNSLNLKIPNNNGILIDYTYTIVNSKLVLLKDDVEFIVATNIDGANGFYFTEATEDKLITVKVKTLSQRYNRTATFEVENHHKIKVDI